MSSEDPRNKPGFRRKLAVFGLALVVVAVFMYVSFIITTAIRGPS